MDIKNALSRLDPTNDEHWTSDGLPRVDAVCGILGASVKRSAITNAAPDFTRSTAQEAASSDPQPELPLETLDGAELEKLEPKDLDAEPAPAPAASVASPSAAPPSEPDAEPAQKTELDLGALADLIAEVDAPHLVAALIRPLDEVVAMAPDVVFGDIDLVERAILEFSRQSDLMARLRDVIQEKIKDVGRRSAMLTKVQQRMGKPAHVQNQRAIQDYLEQQKVARAERAERARRFIAGGTTAEDVGKALRGSSALDAAMKGRKKPLGAGRPVYPRAVPVSATAEV